jgi:hypothetical protein
MSEARPVRRSPERTQKRTPGGTSRENGNWTVVEESKHIRNGYLHSCGKSLMGKAVCLTVRDGIFPLSGSGETKTLTVPYCPKCENEPNGYGFISPDGTIVVH